MTSFSLTIQTVCLGLLSCLMLYTLWLLRSGRLSSHVTVRWVLAECAAILALLLWRWLPMFRYTSTMGDRELLVILAVVFFVLVAFLMLDSLVRISAHTHQIKLLTQELALLRAAVDEHESRQGSDGPADSAPPVGMRTAAGTNGPERVTSESPSVPARGVHKAQNLLLTLWIVLCLAAYLWQIHPGFPGQIKAFLAAGYLQ